MAHAAASMKAQKRPWRRKLFCRSCGRAKPQASEKGLPTTLPCKKQKRCQKKEKDRRTLRSKRKAWSCPCPELREACKVAGVNVRCLCLLNLILLGSGMTGGGIQTNQQTNVHPLHAYRQAGRPTNGQTETETDQRACVCSVHALLFGCVAEETDRDGNRGRDRHTYIHIHTCAGVYMYACRCVRARAYIHIHTCAGVYMYACWCVRARARVCVCVSGCKPTFGMPLTFNTCWNGSPKYSARLLARQLEVPT